MKFTKIDKELWTLSVEKMKILLQGFSADADSIPCSKDLISGSKEKMSHNNLGNKNETKKIYRN